MSPSHRTSNPYEGNGRPSLSLDPKIKRLETVELVNDLPSKFKQLVIDYPAVALVAGVAIGGILGWLTSRIK